MRTFSLVKEDNVRRPNAVGRYSDGLDTTEIIRIPHQQTIIPLLFTHTQQLTRLIQYVFKVKVRCHTFMAYSF